MRRGEVTSSAAGAAASPPGTGVRRPRVLYVSKASRVAAWRDKLVHLARSADVTLVVPRRWGRQPLEAEPRAEGDPPGPPPTLLPALLHGHNHLHVYRGMGRLLDRLRPELVHVDEEPYSLVTVQLARLCRRRGIPYLFFAWQNLDKRLPPPFGRLRRFVFRTAAGGVAGTDAAAAVLRSAGWRGPQAVIPQMGVDPERFRPDAAAGPALRRRLGWPPAARVVGYVGRLVPEKGVEALVRAVAALPGAHLVLVGDGPLREPLARLAEELGAGERVRGAGAVPSLEVAGWTAGFDVLALPSVTTRGWSEQFGRALVEAMACAVPVVASDSGEIPRVVDDAGILVPEGSVEALRGALGRLLLDAGERRRLGEAGRRRALERYTQARVAKETAAFWDEVLGVGRCPR